MKVKIRFSPLILNVPEERGTIYNRVKALLTKAEELAGHENVRIRLRAIEVTARLGMVLTGILKDVQLDEIEEAIDRIERDSRQIQQPQTTRGTVEAKA